MSKPLNKRAVGLGARTKAASAYDPVARVEVLTRTARATWLGLLSYLAFVGVTLLSVQDADFFIRERETALPLIGVTVPTNLFFNIAPLLGAMLYIHLHLYLLKLWKVLAEVPTTGTPQGERIAPWIVSDMALAIRHGTSHAYPLRRLAHTVAFLSIFLMGPVVLAGFWWRSMPKHDELLTIVFCGVPLFASILGGAESWRTLRRGGAEPREIGWTMRGLWALVLVLISVYGFLTTDGILLRPAQLSNVVFVAPPPDWHPREEAEKIFRAQWCNEQGLPILACGSGPLARDGSGDRLIELPMLRWQRAEWCREAMGAATDEPACTTYFATLDKTYRQAWEKARQDSLTALPNRNLSGIDLRHANLSGARMEGADLSEARMERANLSDARMEGANLEGARMEWANLKQARMERAILRRARIEGAILWRARMEGAFLTEAQMDGEITLGGAALSGAAIRETDLSSVPISADQITSMFGDASAILPPGIARPLHWPTWQLDSADFHTEWRKWQASPATYSPPPPP